MAWPPIICPLPVHIRHAEPRHTESSPDYPTGIAGGRTYGPDDSRSEAKAINDTLGHFAGDDVLRRVAGAMQATTRLEDGTYRFGGEEFLAIVRLDGEDDARAAAERIRLAVEALAIEHPGNPPFGVVTVSGGATVIDRTRLAESDDAWLRAADTAMYKAKRRGRNQTVVG
ncbi:MAG TPA: GGDEF domain-containing protein [Candidatus Limnocylindria bacterium]|nr:GGDEF domain-containing protein [Candidatus Limnocylindria bacterium]